MRSVRRRRKLPSYGALDMLGPAVQALSDFAGLKIDVEPELTLQNDGLAQPLQRIANDLLRNEGSIHFRRIDEGDALVHRAPDKRNGGGAIYGAAEIILGGAFVRARFPLASEPHGKHLEGAQLAALARGLRAGRLRRRFAKRRQQPGRNAEKSCRRQKLPPLRVVYA